MAGFVASMMVALVVTVAWAAFAGGRDTPAIVTSAETSAPAPDPSGPPDRARTDPPAGQPDRAQPAGPVPPPPATAHATADVSPDEAARSRPDLGGRGGNRASEGQAESVPARRSVVTPVARRTAPPRPRPPADTTAAGHAGLAEALLAAGDTTGAIAAYNAFLVRNTDPIRERAAIAKLRRLGSRRD